MTLNLESLLVTALVVWAASYILWQAWQGWFGKESTSGCGSSCQKCPSNQSTKPTQGFVELESVGLSSHSTKREASRTN